MRLTQQIDKAHALDTASKLTQPMRLTQQIDTAHALDTAN